MIASLEVIGQRALSSTATLNATYKMARSCMEEEIPGDFVECGVFAGAQVAAMAKACEDRGERRRIHLFDSFAGIPGAGEHDLEFIEAGHPLGLSICTVAQVVQHMEEWGVDPSLLYVHVGPFSETVPEFSGKIAMLRLDGDLYESTRVCLEHLYPKLSPGGWCIVDDFALSGCRKAVLEYMRSNSQFEPMYWRKQ